MMSDFTTAPDFRMSRRRAILFASAGAASCLIPKPLRAFTEESRAISNVTVIDGTGAVRRNQTVLLSGERIASIRESAGAAPPTGPQVVDGTGKFLVPGFWDMHIHLSVTRDSSLPTLLANGVTSVRDMGGSLSELIRWKTLIDSCAMSGPRIFLAGPIVNGKAFNAFQIAVANSDQARGAVTALKNAGVDFIKVHSAISREAYGGVVAECKRTGLHFAGHVPRVMNPAEVCAAGQQTVEHMGVLFDSTLLAGDREGTLSERIARFRKRGGASQLFATFAKNGTAFTPTIVIEKASVRMTEVSLAEGAAFVSKPSRQMVREVREKYSDYLKPESIATHEQEFEQTARVVEDAYRAGVTILAGTDHGAALTAPGFSLHEELALLVQWGRMPPMAAIQAATSSAARTLAQNDLGTIEPGKLADLVMLNANPLDDIRNTRTIDSVFCRGKQLDRQALDRLLEAARKSV